METEMTKELPFISVDEIEEWREYDFGGRIYRILKPVKIYIGNSTHRVVDRGGIVHCVPSPGHHGCVLWWSGAVVA